MDIGRHVGAVAADVDAGPVFEPGVDLPGPAADPVLHVDLLARIAREGEVELVEHAVAEQVLPLELVEEIGAEIAFAEEQPGLAFDAAGFPFLHERAVRGDPGAGPDHDDRSVVVGQEKMVVRLDVDRHGLLLAGQGGEVTGGDPGAGLVMQRVAHGADRQVRFLRRRGKAGSDRVEPRLQRSETGGQLLRVDAGDRVLPDDVDHVVGGQELHPLTGLLGGAERGKLV